MGSGGLRGTQAGGEGSPFFGKCEKAVGMKDTKTTTLGKGVKFGPESPASWRSHSQGCPNVTEVIGCGRQVNPVRIRS